MFLFRKTTENTAVTVIYKTRGTNQVSSQSDRALVTVARALTVSLGDPDFCLSDTTIYETLIFSYSMSRKHNSDQEFKKK